MSFIKHRLQNGYIQCTNMLHIMHYVGSEHLCGVHDRLWHFCVTLWGAEGSPQCGDVSVDLGAVWAVQHARGAMLCRTRNDIHEVRR